MHFLILCLAVHPQFVTFPFSLVVLLYYLRVDLLAVVLSVSAVDAAFGVTLNIVIIIRFGSLFAVTFGGPDYFDPCFLVL